jgi:uncharacterized protein (TIRG00374 family)
MATDPGVADRSAGPTGVRRSCAARAVTPADATCRRAAPARLPVPPPVPTRAARCPALNPLPLATQPPAPIAGRADVASPAQSGPVAGARRTRHHLAQFAALAMVALVVAAAIRLWPEVAASGTKGLGAIEVIWIVPAVGLVMISMVSASLLQRRVLRAGGLSVPVRSMLAIAVASNAVSVTLPLAGSSAGTAFTYLQLKRRGADLPLAGWTLAVSGIISTSVLAVLLGAGATLSDDAATSALGATAVLAGVVPMVTLLAVFRWPAVRRLVERLAMSTLTRVQRRWKRARRIDPASVPAAFDRIAGFRLGPRAAASSAALSLTNWTADIAVLAVCVTAIGASVPWTHLAVIYGAMLGAASLSFTPAGIGIVETALAVTLIEFGTPAELAVIAAILYRALTCWTVLATGWVTYLVLRRRSVVAGAGRDARSVPNAPLAAAQRMLGTSPAG